MAYLEIKDLTIPVGMHYGKHIVFASDHRGYDTKHKILEFLNKKEGILENVLQFNKKFFTTDVGCHSDRRSGHRNIIHIITSFIRMAAYVCCKKPFIKSQYILQNTFFFV